jgi:hypothetical protein
MYSIVICHHDLPQAGSLKDLPQAGSLKGGGHMVAIIMLITGLLW